MGATGIAFRRDCRVRRGKPREVWPRVRRASPRRASPRRPSPPASPTAWRRTMRWIGRWPGRWTSVRPFYGRPVDGAAATRAATGAAGGASAMPGGEVRRGVPCSRGLRRCAREVADAFPRSLETAIRPRPRLAGRRLRDAPRTAARGRTGIVAASAASTARVALRRLDGRRGEIASPPPICSPSGRRLLGFLPGPHLGLHLGPRLGPHDWAWFASSSRPRLLPETLRWPCFSSTLRW